MPPTRRARRRLLRFLEFSPLIVVVIFGMFWLSVPKPLVTTSYLMNTWYTSGHQGFEERAEEYFASVLGAPSGSLESDFEDAVSESYNLSAAHHDDLFDPARKPVSMPWSEDSEWFEPLRRFEDAWGARVYAYATPAPSMPSLVATAFAETSLLPTAEELADASLGVDGKPTAYPPSPPELGPASYGDELEWVWWLGRKYGPAHPFFSPGAPVTPEQSSAGDLRYVFETYRANGSDFYYYAYVRGARDATSDSPYPPGDAFNPLDTLDVGSDEFRSELERIAADLRANVFVAGPLEIRLVPVYPDDKVAAVIGALPEVVESTKYTINTGLKEAPDSLTELTGARWMMTVPLASGPTPDANGDYLSTPSAEPQGFAYVATWDERPSVLSSAWSSASPTLRAWLQWQRFLAANFGWLLGAGLALLGATLIASPAAFIYERRLATEERLLAEMARVQQDAHDKVYNRLSALSKRVSLAGAELSREVAQKLDELSEDIRSTVADLQGILGDADRRTSELTGVSGLAEQLGQVCRAQAARLDLDVRFEAEGELPVMPPDASWDLQCIVEEALTNAAKNGRAAHADVRVSATENRLALDITDDGAGVPENLDIDALPSDAKGLRGMHARAERLGGTLVVERLERGSRVALEVPVIKHT